jgi:retinol dehydrogenase-13
MSLGKKTKKYLSQNCPVDLKGKTILITGGNSGIGFKTAEIMLYLGANVILACRNLERANKAKEELLSEYKDCSVEIMLLDLASFKSIDRFVYNIIDNRKDIDCFINNAGIFHQPNKKTAEGFELVMGTNYFGTYYLSEKVLPYLETLGHRVTYINTISIIHKIAKLDYSDFYCERHYGNFRIYAKSKLALAKYTNYLVKKYEGTNIKIYMNHPGISITPIGLKAYGKAVYKIADVAKFIFNSPEKSALGTAYILSHDIATGSVVGPSGFINGWGYPNVNKVCDKTLEGIDELITFTKGEFM